MSEKNTKKTELKQSTKERQLKGLIPFKKGQSGNPNGRPKGTVSVVSKIKSMLDEIPTEDNKEKKTYLELLVKTIMTKSIKDKDTQMIRDLINRVDGLPKQTLGLDTRDNGNITGINITFSSKEDDS